MFEFIINEVEAKNDNHNNAKFHDDDDDHCRRMSKSQDTHTYIVQNPSKFRCNKNFDGEII